MKRASKKKKSSNGAAELAARTNFQAALYDALRDYQDGKIKGNSTAVGHLSQELTGLYDRINKVVDTILISGERR